MILALQRSPKFKISTQYDKEDNRQMPSQNLVDTSASFHNRVHDGIFERSQISLSNICKTTACNLATAVSIVVIV